MAKLQNYFSLDRGTGQRSLEVSFVLIKSNNNIKGVDIYDHTFLYIADVDESSFFFKNSKSVIEAFNILDEFSFFYGLKPNKEKCEVVGIDVKKVVKVALCGVTNIDLKKKRSENSRSSLFLHQKN